MNAVRSRLFGYVDIADNPDNLSVARCYKRDRVQRDAAPQQALDDGRDAKYIEAVALFRGLSAFSVAGRPQQPGPALDTARGHLITVRTDDVWVNRLRLRRETVLRNLLRATFTI